MEPSANTTRPTVRDVIVASLGLLIMVIGLAITSGGVFVGGASLAVLGLLLVLADVVGSARHKRFGN
jgi:hypothetical protein